MSECWCQIMFPEWPSWLIFKVLAGFTGLPEGFSRKPSQLKKPVSTPEGKNGGAAGSSAPETPEQVFTPKQDRHGSRSLDEVR